MFHERGIDGRGVAQLSGALLRRGQDIHYMSSLFIELWYSDASLFKIFKSNVKLLNFFHFLFD